MGDFKMKKEILVQLKNKQFLTKIWGFSTKQEVIKAFNDEGIEISEEEVDELNQLIINMISKVSEMSEDELQNISGGQYFWNDLFDVYHDKLGLSVNASDALVLSSLIAGTLGIGSVGYIGIKKLKEGKWWGKK